MGFRNAILICLKPHSKVNISFELFTVSFDKVKKTASTIKIGKCNFYMID